MHPRIAFAKTGWSEECCGAPVVGRHAYISEYEEAYERLNFLPGPDERFYAYVPLIGKHQGPPNPSEKEGWLVIFVAARDGNGPLTVVGWYEDASFEASYKARREYELGVPFETPSDGGQFVYCISAPTARLFLPAQRAITVPGAHFRRSPIIYARGGGKSDPWRAEFAKLAERLVASDGVAPKEPTPSGLKYPDAEHRKQVEVAAVEAVVSYLKKRRYKVADRQGHNCGYDLLATRAITPRELHVEVKGTSEDLPRFFLPLNEMRYLSHPKWRLAIVTNALREPIVALLTEDQVRKKFEFTPVVWEARLKKTQT